MHHDDISAFLKQTISFIRQPAWVGPTAIRKAFLFWELSYNCVVFRIWFNAGSKILRPFEYSSQNYLQDSLFIQDEKIFASTVKMSKVENKN